jgi:hypothetical protein
MHRDASDGTFGGVVVDLDTAVIGIAVESGPTAESIADGPGEIGFGRELRQDCFDPRAYGEVDADASIDHHEYPFS